MPKEIELEDVRRLIKEGAQLVDVLPPREFEGEHLPGAINIPLKALDERSAARLDKGRPVVVYCWDFQ
jgi:rhodanese-related sulfurtransferase